jgi:hypothetical protein
MTNTLFRRFGGNTPVSQEVVSPEQVVQAEEKWPMLGQIKPTTPHDAPSAKRALSTHIRQPQDGTMLVLPHTVHSMTSAVEAPAPVSSHKGPQGQGLNQFFQGLASDSRAPQGAMERVAQKGESAASSSASGGLFAGFLPPQQPSPSNPTQKSMPSSNANGGFLGGGQGRASAPSPFNAYTHPKKTQESNSDSVLGRKLGGQASAGVAAASTETKSNLGSLGRTDSASKGSELQQIFGKIVSHAEPPVPANKKTTTGNRPQMVYKDKYL